MDTQQTPSVTPTSQESSTNQPTSASPESVFAPTPVLTQATPEVTAVAPVSQALATPTAPTQLSQQDLVKAVIEGVRAGQPQPQQTPAQSQGMTDAEFNRKFGVVNVDAAMYESILGAAPDRPERVQALNNLVQGIARQAVLMSQALVQNEVGSVKSSLQPLQSAHQKAYEDGLWSEFGTQYADLKEEKALIDELTAAHIGKGTKFSSKDEAFKTVAGQARSIITRMRGTSGSSVGQASQSTKPAARQMTPTSMGGRGGSGQTTKKSTIEQVFADS